MKMSTGTGSSTVLLTRRELESKWKDMLGATLEAWAHMILFVRKVYPEESFCSPKSTLFGLRLHQNRHPLVVSYISEAIEVALPALTLTPAIADSISLTVTEIPPAGATPLEDATQVEAHHQGKDCRHNNESKQQSQDQEKQLIQPEPVVLETYELRFPQLDTRTLEVSNDNNNNSVYTRSAIEYLEREMRAILLAVFALKDTDDNGAARSALDDSLSFTISLHIPEANATCDSLNRAMASGQWRTTPTPTATSMSWTKDRIPYVLRPLHEMDALTSPVGPVQFLVKYPRNIVAKRKAKR